MARISKLYFRLSLSKISFSINRPNFSFATKIGNEIKEDKWLPRKTSNIPSYTSSNKKSESAHLSNHERRRKIAVSKNKLKWIYIVFLNNFCWTLLRGSINWPKRKSNLIKDKCNQCGITCNTSRSTGCSRLKQEKICFHLLFLFYYWNICCTLTKIKISNMWF